LGGEKTATSASIKTPALPVFQPKNLGAPKVRVGGGSRGQNSSETELYVLAPEQTGFTTHSQPVLYWYVSRPVNQPIEITVTDKLSVLLKTSVKKLSKAGIQTLDLTEHNIQLQPDIKYKWSVAIVNNPQQRSGDTFASAGIMLVPENEELRAKLAVADNKDQVLIYAREGIWYDALAAIQSLAEKYPRDESPVVMRTHLLQQVGLSVFEWKH
jgi:hypothetical protein